MQAEKTRGITYVVLAGAEPSLVPALLEVCYDEMPLGSIATNGFKKIPESVRYKIHISVWGNDETSYQVRKAKNLLKSRLKIMPMILARFLFIRSRGKISMKCKPLPPNWSRPAAS